MKASADVVIIGGGCMGASAAYHLARLGIGNIVLVEKEPMLGMGSTGRNAGGVRHQFSSEANVRLSIESIRTFERFEEEVGYPIDFWQDGYLFLLSTVENLRSFQTNANMQRRLGVDVDVLSPGDVRHLLPALRLDGVIGATFCGRDGIADPNGVTMGFARAAQARGLEIYRNTEVIAIECDNRGVCKVATSRGDISTRVVVNAAGPNARAIGKMVNLDVPVLPYRRHIFITEPLSDDQLPTTRMMVIDFETTFYFHREGAGFLFGMSNPEEKPGFDTTVNWEFLEKVTRVALKRVPRLGDAGIAHSWAGLYEMTPDAMPIISAAREVEGYFIIAGFSGHGFQHCPAAGRIAAELITLGKVGDIDPSPFAFERFDNGRTITESNVV
jgi:sarcosine oxidase subunit beta